MLSYQHGYHAGNFADVVKHLTLTRLLTYLTLKDKPLFYLETHAGKGLYSLGDKQAEKTGEYRKGISLIWQNRNKFPSLFAPYLHTIDKLNANSDLQYYPGSPHIALEHLRAQDRLYLCELHPTEFKALHLLPAGDKKIHLAHVEGLSSLKGLLPPPERRGLIFIDPSFECKEEYKEIPRALEQAFKQFSTGVYCLWYPIAHPRLTEQLIRKLKSIPYTKALHLEFMCDINLTTGMKGCGLWIINPPYVLEEEMKNILNTLSLYFNPPNSSYTVEYIVHSKARTL